MPKLHAVTGTILAVQEQRFRLSTTDGRGLLLTLARDGLVDRLAAWRDAGTSLAVRYEGEPNLASGVARSIRPLAARAAEEVES